MAPLLKASWNSWYPLLVLLVNPFRRARLSSSVHLVFFLTFALRILENIRMTASLTMADTSSSAIPSVQTEQCRPQTNMTHSRGHSEERELKQPSCDSWSFCGYRLVQYGFFSMCLAFRSQEKKGTNWHFRCLWCLPLLWLALAALNAHSETNIPVFFPGLATAVCRNWPRHLPCSHHD